MGRRFRILAIVEDFTRECLALVADTSLPGQRVGEYYFAWSFPSRCETKLEAIACSFTGASFSVDNR